MADKPPLLFRKRFGALRPTNEPTEAALAAYSGNDVLKAVITRASGNTRRNGLYWAVLGIAAPMLGEKAEGLTVDMLHRILKRRTGRAKPITLPSGDVEYDYESIAFNSMPEHERSEYVTAAFGLLSDWLGCDVRELENEGRAAA